MFVMHHLTARSTLFKCLYFQITTDVYSSARSLVLTRLFSDLLEEHLNEFAYDAEVRLKCFVDTRITYTFMIQNCQKWLSRSSMTLCDGYMPLTLC